MAQIVRAWGDGDVSTGVALVRAMLAAGGLPLARAELDALARESDEARALLGALTAREAACARAELVLSRAAEDDAGAGEDRDAGEALRRCRAFFDWAAAHDEVLAAAVYTLADPEELARATRELVELLEARGLLGPERTVLDLGCGAGRLTAALAARSARVLGVDISAEMLARARVHCAHLSGAAFARVHDARLDGIAPRSIDLVVAVDVFPYLVRQRLAAQSVGEIARVLRAGGSAAIFNWSYRGDDREDARDVARLAAGAGMGLVSRGERPLRHWDGRFFHLCVPWQ